MKKLVFFAAAASMMFAACSSDNEEVKVAEKSAIRLSTQSLTSMTRAGQSIQLTQFDADENVSIFLVEDVNGTQTPSGTNVTTYSNPLAYTTGNAGALTPAAAQYWPQDGNGLFIFGIYPASAVTSSTAYNGTDITFSVAADQSSTAGYKASDLMMGAPTGGNPVTRTTSEVPMTFTHLLTKINVNLTAGDGFTETEMNNAEVSILGVKPTTTFGVQGTAVTEGSGTATNIAAGTGASTSAIIVPQTVMAGNFIKITIGGGDYYYALAANKFFASQTLYTYNLTVNKTGLLLTATTITAWADGGSADGTATLQ
ncbi:MAG: fimbrillin family protein [Bacteroidaceae bacterium]|nr:fimbrillin family protein [Bacteroidaceae bacterium]MBR4897234.1 fimbrillin family protein [Prevotella sp.]